MLQEFRRPAGVRPEHQPRLAVDEAQVQMQRAQRRCPRRGDPVHLGPVRGSQRRVVGTQKPAADREAGETLDLSDPGLLQQRQRVATGADEHESWHSACAFRRCDDFRPAASSCHRSAGSGCGPRDRTARSTPLRTQIADELLGQRTEVDVGARRRPSSAQPARRSHVWPPSTAAGGRIRPGRRSIRCRRTADCRPTPAGAAADSRRARPRARNSRAGRG